MRNRISDRNIFPNDFSVRSEYLKLRQLFMDRTAFGRELLITSRTRPHVSYYDCLNSNMFLRWDLRGSFTDLQEMLTGLQIREDDFAGDCTQDRLLDYIQFILNAIVFVDESVQKGGYELYKNGDTIYDAIVDQSKLLLTRLGAELRGDDTELYIIYADNAATALAEREPELSVSILDYLRIDNRGDFRRKGEILCTLAKQLEPLEKEFKGKQGFEQLCSDTTFLLNNIGARHYQNPANKMNAKFMKLSDAELESWYDNAFDLFIACMSVLPYLSLKDQIKQMKIV